MSDVRADQIAHALSKRHRKDLFLTEVKTDSTWVGRPMRIDAIAVKKSWVQPCITGYEIKVSRSDFMGDQKYPAYLPFCHCFSFACPTGLIKPEELHESIGLVWYKPETGGLTTKRKALYKHMDEIPSRLLYYIALSRVDSDRHPFFSDARKFCEAWLQDKADRYTLGADVRQRVQSLLTADADEAKKQIERLESQMDEFEGIQRTLRNHNIYGLSELDRQLSKPLPPRVRRFLENTKNNASDLLKNGDEAA